MRKLLCLALATLSLLVARSERVRAEEPAFLSLGAGVYDLLDNETTAEARVEYRFSKDNKLGLFTPFVGFMATADGATYGYGGVGIDILLGKHWALTPNVAVGLYGNGDGKDLGHPVEFRSGLELAYRFDDDSRLGLAFHHISNAHLDNENPGSEALMLMYSVPFDKFFGD